MSTACARAPTAYRRREPERTVLHAELREHLTTFLATHDVPRHVRRYVDCGVLALREPQILWVAEEEAMARRRTGASGVRQEPSATSKKKRSPSLAQGGDVLAARKGKSPLARGCARRLDTGVGDGGRVLRRGLRLRVKGVVNTVTAPSRPRDRRETVSTTPQPTKQAMYVAFELSAERWTLGLSNGKKLRRVTIDARDMGAYEKALAEARAKLGVAKDAPVYSCYEAGRDGFWLHRWMEGLAGC